MKPGLLLLYSLFPDLFFLYIKCVNEKSGTELNSTILRNKHLLNNMTFLLLLKTCFGKVFRVKTAYFLCNSSLSETLQSSV
jgi:hypothetical protein